jgi:hypothetical protein
MVSRELQVSVWMVVVIVTSGACVNFKNTEHFADCKYQIPTSATSISPSAIFQSYFSSSTLKSLNGKVGVFYNASKIENTANADNQSTGSSVQTTCNRVRSDGTFLF